MRKTRRYSLQIKDAKGSIVFATAAVWDGHDRRAAVAKILRLDGVLEAPSFPSQRSGEDAATNLDVERMAASFTIATAAKKKPRH
jgi:methylmalonyl-CoA mutase cobalamin-binding subunit